MIQITNEMNIIYPREILGTNTTRHMSRIDMILKRAISSQYLVLVLILVLSAHLILFLLELK